MNLWDHQKACIERNKELDYFALFFEMGTGKTLTTIKIIEQKFEKEGRYLRTLVLCPLVMINTWKREFDKYSTIRRDQVITLEGTTGERMATYMGEKYPSVFITNYDGLVYSGGFYNSILENPPEVVVIDESQKIANPKAKRTKRCTEIGNLAKYRYILSGTPVLNSALNLFSQFLFLDKGRTFGKSFWIFRAQYFDDMNRARAGTQNYFPQWEIRPGKAEEIKRLIEPISMRVKKSDALDLPELVRITQYVELSDEQKKAYKEMKRDLITMFKDAACTASIALTKTLRLQQIVSGFLKMEDGAIVRFDNSPRLSALRELLEDLTPNYKVIVWCVWSPDYEAIRKLCSKEELNIKYAEVTGEINNKDEQVQLFQNDESVRIIICHTGAGGAGISLTRAAYSIGYSRNFSYEQDAQALARNHRSGSEQHEKITRIDLVAKGCVDEIALDAVKMKAENSEQLLPGSQELLKRIKESLTNE